MNQETDYKKEYKIIFKAFFLLFGLFLLQSYLLLSTNNVFDGSNKFGEHYLSQSELFEKINYEGQFEPYELSLINQVIEDLKIPYRNFDADITFTKSLEELQSYCDNEKSRGCNYESLLNGKSKIIIYFENSEYIMKKRVCHEILHDVVQRKESLHNIVYDLGSEGVCYKDFGGN